MKGRELEKYLASPVGTDPSTCQPELPPGIKFDQPEHALAIRKCVYEKESIFLTGCAGSGKTTLVKHLIGWMKNIYGKKEVKTTATYGSAAVNTTIPGASTFHKFMGIGIGKKRGEKTWMTKEQAFASVNRDAVVGIREAKVLFLDEMSAMPYEYFELANHVAQRVRGQPGVFFGGIQLVLLGDIKQLPPTEGTLIVLGPLWRQYGMDHNTILLRKNYRQSGDQSFLDMINEMRDGKQLYKNFCFSKKGIRLFLKCAKPHEERESYRPEEIIVTIVSTREEAKQINDTELAKLNTPKFVYSAIAKGDPFYHDQFRKHLLTPEILVVKPGARVLITANVDVEEGLCNGAPAVVERCEQKVVAVRLQHSDRVVELTAYTWMEMTDEGILLSSWTQFPLMLAYGVTTEKSQGLTIPKIRVDFANMFPFKKDIRSAYVACSRTPSAEGLEVKNIQCIDWSKMRQDPSVNEWFDNLASRE